jgi:hypothetical protein
MKAVVTAFCFVWDKYCEAKEVVEYEELSL